MNGLDLAPRRAELGDAVDRLEQVLAVAHGQSVISDEIRDLLEHVKADLAVHRALAEGRHGLHLDIVRSSPRHAHAVRRLNAEHRVLAAHVNELCGHAASRVFDGGVAMERVQACAQALIREIARHRQREADVVHEAYDMDLGGET
jgi:uncharacterized protein (UPF0335 family)